MKNSRVIQRAGPVQILISHLGRRILLWQRKRISAKGYAALAVIPGDEIGMDVLQFGLYEEEILRPLFDQVLVRFADRFKAGRAIDVGANIGNHTLFFSSRFAEVSAFEPAKIASLLLQANVALNNASNIKVFPFGLSDCETTATLSSRQDSNLGSSAILDDAALVGTASESIQLRKGDDVLETSPSDRELSLVKIDVEGHELQVVRGLSKTLLSQHPIVLFEVMPGVASPSHGKSDIVGALRELGYKNFYTLARDYPLPNWPAARFLLRLLVGAKFVLQAHEKLDNRFYNLAIATAGEELL